MQLKMRKNLKGIRYFHVEYVHPYILYISTYHFGLDPTPQSTGTGDCKLYPHFTMMSLISNNDWELLAWKMKCILLWVQLLVMSTDLRVVTTVFIIIIH